MVLSNVEMKKKTKTKRKFIDDGRQDIRAVANFARVSIATVSRVVNHHRTVDPKLATRVLEAIETLKYVPNKHARALVSGKSKMLGVLISDITNPFFPELIQGFEDSAVRMGYETMIGSTNYDLQKMEACVDRMLQRNVDGVAVMTFGIEEPILDRLASHGIPMIFIDVAPSSRKSVAISIDYSKGIFEGVQHLAVLGHRKIAFISGPPGLQSAMARLNAFQAATREIGLSIASEYVITGDHTLDRGKAAADALLKLKNPPSAIMCSNDLTAIGAMHALSSAGLQIPTDVSVIGFDDVHFSEFLMPPLTTIRMSRIEIAKVAVTTLGQLIDGKFDQKVQSIDTKLVVRRSTSIPAGALADIPPISEDDGLHKT
jgi:DNA-binding LacI/PurR family transcriptional regulator